MNTVATSFAQHPLVSFGEVPILPVTQHFWVGFNVCDIHWPLTSILPPEIQLCRIVKQPEISSQLVLVTLCLCQNSYGKSQFYMGKSTINGQFSIAMLNYQRVPEMASGWCLIQYCAAPTNKACSHRSAFSQELMAALKPQPCGPPTKHGLIITFLKLARSR